MERGRLQSALGRTIRRYREDQHMRLTELARLAGVSRSYVYQIENGQSSPTVGVVKSIATALGVRVADLVDEDDPLRIPESLKSFAEEDNIEPGDLKMLAQINYRGRRPDSPEEWRLLWRVIRASAGEE